ncbi:nuclear transport factor 2 family protein [Ekhidna sp.]|uniref:nuclear transport factor 2 family protein n=1 Tax=Ekhidna sp. TaxID=2608089 RepID=UPI003519B5C6
MKPLLSFLITIVLTSCSTSTTEKSPNRDDLYRALDSFNLAFKKGDISQLASMITDNYVHTNGSWKSFSKEKWLGYMKDRSRKINNGSLLIETYEMDELSIEMHDDAAIVTARISTAGIEDNERFNKQFRVSNFWIFDEGRWLRAGFQDTPLQ